ncbi:hypothetical protein [Tautonia marina]|uniref:hypothetical protein n=1 Tax=Tautonia marina TaxID=2653855 RepID=UPI001260667B|nr:hypothetical protein [Tautonia marina]
MAVDRSSRWRRGPLAVLLLGMLVAPAPGIQDETPRPATSLDDPRLVRLRQAAAVWELRTGPRREVVDVVCLVPNTATFFKVLGTWDSDHWFPILIEDVEYTSKFLRAFRPAQIVRVPDSARPVEGEDLWSAATKAVGRAWTSGNDRDAPDGDQPPTGIRRPPPGVVLSNPASRSLPGAAALAAGRFQPLIRWDAEGQFDTMLSNTDAQALARELQATVGRVVPSYQRLGDDCDFLTLALKIPYRYEGKGVTAKGGPAAFDDLIGRHLDVAQPDQVRIRWAFAGRLLGDEVRSVYAAMCSLFLQPDRATLINSYNTTGSPFGDYQHGPAADRLKALMPVTQRNQNQTGLRGWHTVFDPVNRSSLVLINSSGGSREYKLGRSQTGWTWDVPLTEPAIVYKVHSFSAANPTDSNTIAGRWLANGAFLYFGSAHEPYLQSFRTPELLVDLMVRGLPLGAAVRMLPEELPPFGNCWRLAYLGDPLFRFDPNPPAPRLDQWAPLAEWPVYGRPSAPSAPDDPLAVLSWVVQLALDAARHGEPTPDDAITALLSFDRSRFNGPLRDVRDMLIADSLAQQNRFEDLRNEFGRWPRASLGPSAKRWLESARVRLLQRALDDDDWAEATSIWTEIVRSEPSVELLRSLSLRVRPSTEQADRVAKWRRLLQSAKQTLKRNNLVKVIDQEQAHLDRKTD